MNQLLEVPIQNLQSNPLNPSSRVPDKELIESIKTNGIITPLIVQVNASKDHYIVIAGERRLKAAKELGLKTVPVLVRETEEGEAGSLLLVDNIHRKNMSMWEEYLVITELLKTKTIAEIAKALNKSQLYVRRRTQLGNLILPVQTALQNNVPGLTERIVFIFARLPELLQTKLYQRSTREQVLNGKKSVVFMEDENELQRYAERLLQESFFKGQMKPEELLKVFGTPDAIGNESLDHATKVLFDEKQAETIPSVAKPSMDDLKKTKEAMKQLKDATLLSTEMYSYVRGAITKDCWREATKNDDPKTVHDGVIVDGQRAGKLVSFVKVDPEKKQKEKDNRPAAQIEKDRKVRREKILNNRATNEAIGVLGRLIQTKAAKLGPDMKLFILKHYGNQEARKVLKVLCTAEEYEKVTFENAPKKLAELVDFKDERFYQILLMGPEVLYNYEDVAKVYGESFKDMKKKCRDIIDTQIKAKQLAAETKRLANKKSKK